MRKLTVFVALALLAAAGTGYAVTCAYDNVPGATLLIPYFSVTGTVDAAGQIGSVGVDTKIAFTNVSGPGVIAHVTVWNKYSKAVLDFNVPMTGKDVVTMNMSSILSGHLNINTPMFDKVQYPDDVCGWLPGNPLPDYIPGPWIGWGSTDFLRFANPEFPTGTDWIRSVSQYDDPAFDATVGARLLDSLDQSGDVKSMAATGANVLDTTNYYCGLGTNPTITPGPIAVSGYVTIDVVNYCTNYFPDQLQFYENDAVATSGWSQYGYTPNVLIGDVFFVDPAANVGNISGDQAIGIEFDTRLNWTAPATPPDTFYGRFVNLLSTCEKSGGGTCLTPGPAPFFFGGDGREPLGDRYGFRFLSDSANGLRSWMLVWRSDQYVNPTKPADYNLCDWLKGTTALGKGPKGYGLYDTNHQLTYLLYDNDENLSTQLGPKPCPSPCDPGQQVNLYIFLESQRIDLLDNFDLNAARFKGGWVDLTLRNTAPPTPYSGIYNQGWIGVQHTGPGTLLNVGHGATSLDGNFVCNPAIVYGPGVSP